VHESQPSFDSLAAVMIAVLILFPLGPASAGAVSQNASEESGGGDPGQSAYAAGRFIDALRIWRPRAEQGDARAAFGLGLLYDLGEGVQQDAAGALNWYRRAAEAGYVPAEFNVAVMFDSGTGTERNRTEAALWYARAAAHGYARAEYNLAQLYQAGEGAPRNLEMAANWYAAAAAHGLSAAARQMESLRESTELASARPYGANPTLAPAVPAGPLVPAVSETGDRLEVELSWAAPAEPVPVKFFVQVLSLDTTGAKSAFTGFVKQSAVLVSLPRAPAAYVWRIYTVAASIPDYAPSAWSTFSTR
jgi:hypothetical protein